MPFIYRMQNKIGDGCYMARNYRPSDEVEEFIQYHAGSNGRPCPQEDFGIMRNAIMGEEICGFATLRQAVKWFPHYERKFLRLDDFNIVKVEVKEITAIGKAQVLAKPYKKVAKYMPITFSNDIFDFSMP
jgi:hypothetical protein